MAIGTSTAIAVGAATVGTAVALKGQRDAKKAGQNAANQQRQASIESAQVLAKAGKQGEADIMMQNAEARFTSNMAAVDAAEQIRPFADTNAFNETINSFLGNLPIDGAIADSIKRSSTDFVMSRPEFRDMIGDSPVGREIDRQGDLAVSAATPQFNDSLMQNAQAGLAGATDLAQIEQSGLNRLGSIAGGEASQRSNILMGQAPALTQLRSSADNAQLLSSVVGQNFRTGATEQIAGLAGNVSQQFAADRNRQQTLDAEFKQRQGQNRNLSDTMGSF
jgi:hypothetical protein